MSFCVNNFDFSYLVGNQTQKWLYNQHCSLVWVLLWLVSHFSLLLCTHYFSHMRENDWINFLDIIEKVCLGDSGQWVWQNIICCDKGPECHRIHHPSCEYSRMMLLAAKYGSQHNYINSVWRVWSHEPLELFHLSSQDNNGQHHRLSSQEKIGTKSMNGWSYENWTRTSILTDAIWRAKFSGTNKIKKVHRCIKMKKNIFFNLQKSFW